MSRYLHETIGALCERGDYYSMIEEEGKNKRVPCNPIVCKLLSASVQISHPYMRVGRQYVFSGLQQPFHMSIYQVQIKYY